MFRVATPEFVEIQVRVEPPGGSPGEFTIRVRYRGVKERTDYLTRIQDESLVDAIVIADSLVGWRNLHDEDGAPLVFEDPVVRAAVLDHYYIYIPVRDAIVAELTGGKVARKN